MSSSSQAPPKKSKGRQKVTMAKMSNESNLQVTFSKRRAGLFKKASEICTLSGAEAGVVVFSPADKAFCFGHPNVETIIDKFEQKIPDQMPPNNARSQLLIQAHRNSTIRELNLELTQVESLLRSGKRRAEELDMLKKLGQVQGWYFASFEAFSFDQLGVLKDAIMGFKKNLDVKVQNDMFVLANPLPNLCHPIGNNENNNYSGFQNIGDNISSVPKLDNSQLTNVFNPYYDNGAIGCSNNVGLFGPNNGTNYGLVDQGSIARMIGGVVPIDYNQMASGNAGFGSSNDQGYNMGFDYPRLF